MIFGFGQKESPKVFFSNKYYVPVNSPIEPARSSRDATAPSWNDLEESLIVECPLDL